VSEGERVAELLGLEPLPGEGGLFRRTHVDAYSAAIYFLLIAPDFSAMHRLTATETYHWYAGSPLRLLLLGGAADVSEPVLGPDLTAGQRPQIVVPAGTWQGSSSAGEWTLVVGVVADKDARAIVAPLCARATRVIATAPPSTRALPAAELAKLIPGAEVAPDLAAALAMAAGERIVVAAWQRSHWPLVGHRAWPV